MNRPAALIFDVDGTLAETEEAHRAAFNRSFKDWRLGWHWDRTAYGRLLQTPGGKERIRAYQTTLPDGARRLQEAEIARLHAEKTARYGEILEAGGHRPRPGVAGLIERAAARGVRLAVATTTNLPNVEALCRALWQRPADEVFAVIAAGDEVAAKKPAPDVYRLALARLDLAPGAAIALEDSRNGVVAARAAGLAVIAAPSAYTAAEDFDGAALLVAGLDDPRALRLALGPA